MNSPEELQALAERLNVSKRRVQLARDELSRAIEELIDTEAALRSRKAQSR